MIQVNLCEAYICDNDSFLVLDMKLDQILIKAIFSKVVMSCEPIPQGIVSCILQ